MRQFILLAILPLVIGFLACSSPSKEKNEYVVIIGFDGLSAEVVREHPEDFATFNYLAKKAQAH